MDRRRFFFGEQPTPPTPDYTYLQYIQNPSTAYINTLITLTSDYGVRLVISDAQSTDQIFFGSSRELTIGCSGNGRSMYYNWKALGNTPSSNRPSIGTDKTIVEANYQNNKIFQWKHYNDANYSTIAQPGTTTTFTGIRTAFIFATHGTSDTPTSPSKIKLYECIFTNGNTIVANFKPAKRNSDQAIGLYDTVRNQFFVSPNGVAFIAGPEIVIL